MRQDAIETSKLPDKVRRVSDHMPLEYEVNKDDDYIRITGVGALAVDEYVELNRAISEDEKCQGITRRLYDMKQVEIAQTYERQNSLNERTKNSSGEKLAILVGSEVAFGMARIYQSLADQVTVEIFYNEQKALDWLFSDT